MCYEFVCARREIQAKWRASVRFSVHKNLGAAGFTGDVCDRADESERFTRGVAALHFDVASHFPIAPAGHD